MTHVVQVRLALDKCTRSLFVPALQLDSQLGKALGVAHVNLPYGTVSLFAHLSQLRLSQWRSKANHGAERGRDNRGRQSESTSVDKHLSARAAAIRSSQLGAHLCQ